MDITSLRGLDAHRAARTELAARLTEIDSEAEGRPLSDEARAEFEAISGDKGLLEQLDATIDELAIRESVVREAIGKPDTHSEGGRALTAPNVKKSPENVFDLAAYRQRVSSVDELPEAYREGALRAMDAVSFPTTDREKAKAAVAKLLAKDDERGTIARRVIGTGSPVYQEAWAAYVKGGMNAVPPRLQAALQTYTDADGGVAIPFTIDPTFINTSDGVVNPLRQMARVETIATKQWQGVTTAGVSASYVSETTAASDAAPTDFDNPTITPVRAQVMIDYTAEYQEDYGAGALASEIGGLIQSAKDVLEADKFVNGEGTSEPLGIVDAIHDDSTSLVATATAHTFALGDVDKLMSSVPPRFRAKAQFLANLAILQLIPAFGSAGQPGNSIYDALSGKLRGKPTNEASEMADAATDSAEILLYGDFNQFVIVDRIGLTTEYVPQIFDGNGRPLGRRGVYARWRNSSGVLAFNAFRLLYVKAS